MTAEKLGSWSVLYFISKGYSLATVLSYCYFDYRRILLWNIWSFDSRKKKTTFSASYEFSLSSSSCHAISVDMPDPFSPPFSINHCFQLFRATSRISTELLYGGSSWSSCLCSSMWRGPQKYVAYDLVRTSPAVSHMSCSSNFDSFRVGW